MNEEDTDGQEDHQVVSQEVLNTPVAWHENGVSKGTNHTKDQESTEDG